MLIGNVLVRDANVQPEVQRSMHFRQYLFAFDLLDRFFQQSQVGIEADDTDVPVLLASVDGEGYVTGTTGWPEGSEIDAPAVEASVRQMLRLPAAPTPTHPVLGEHPRAPEVTGTDLDGKSFRLSTLRGTPVVVIFFLHTCPHCHHALSFLKAQLAQMPAERRPQLVGFSVVDRAYAVRERMKADGLDFFPILMDPDGSLRANLFARARIDLGASRALSLVPADALQRAGTAEIVFVQLAADRYEARRVRAGARRGELVEIFSGIEPGELVATRGSFLLKTETLKGSIGAGCCEVE